MTKLAAVLLPQLPPERLREVAVIAEDAGLDEVWLWEDCFWGGGIACAAAVLAGTRRLRVGVGVLPVPLRTVALTAMEVATLGRLFPGRCLIGVGHGVQDWMAQVGARVDSPMTLLREYLTALRALLHGEQVNTQGRYVRLDAVKLDWPPPAPMPVFAGATGPRSLRLSGELADGTVLTGGTSLDQLVKARELVNQGRELVGQQRAHQLVVYLRASGDPAAVAEQVHRFADAGADTVVLQPGVDEADTAEGATDFVRMAARVRALLG